jgi:hypothetical protein
MAKVGRKSKLDIIDYKMVERMCSLFAATDQQLADCLGVSISTIKNWKNKDPRFVTALNEGKKSADEKVEESLYQRAMGYSHHSEHISTHQGKVKRTPTIEHFPPDTTACIFWLKNRQPDKWREKAEVFFPEGLKVQVVYDNLDKNPKQEQPKQPEQETHA